MARTSLRSTAAQGNDLVEVRSLYEGSVTADLGSGDDRYVVSTALEGGTTPTLGAGTDTVELSYLLAGQARGADRHHRFRGRQRRRQAGLGHLCAVGDARTQRRL